YATVVTLAFVGQLGLLPASFARTAANYYANQVQAAGQPTPTEAHLFNALALACLLVYVALWVRLMVFALPLVFDRGYGPVKAMATSWRMSRGHFWGLLGVAAVLWLIGCGWVFDLLPFVELLILLVALLDPLMGLLLLGVLILLVLIAMPFAKLVYASGY